MKRALATVALVATFVLIIQRDTLFYTQSRVITPAYTKELRTVELRGQRIRVTVSDTESTKKQGLSGRLGLATDEGMLFVFLEDGKYAFWMKNMRFSIDILWLSADPSNPSGQATVVYMAQNVSPDTYPQVFASDSPARYVLELPAGYAERQNIRIGDIMRL